MMRQILLLSVLAGAAVAGASDNSASKPFTADEQLSELTENVRQIDQARDKAHALARMAEASKGHREQARTLLKTKDQRIQARSLNKAMAPVMDRVQDKATTELDKMMPTEPTKVELHAQRNEMQKQLLEAQEGLPHAHAHDLSAVAEKSLKELQHLKSKNLIHMQQMIKDNQPQQLQHELQKLGAKHQQRIDEKLMDVHTRNEAESLGKNMMKVTGAFKHSTSLMEEGSTSAVAQQAALLANEYVDAAKAEKEAADAVVKEYDMGLDGDNQAIHNARRFKRGELIRNIKRRSDAEKAKEELEKAEEILNEVKKEVAETL